MMHTEVQLRPAKDDWRSFVSVESRQGTCDVEEDEDGEEDDMELVRLNVAGKGQVRKKKRLEDNCSLLASPSSFFCHHTLQHSTQFPCYSRRNNLADRLRIKRNNSFTRLIKNTANKLRFHKDSIIRNTGHGSVYLHWRHTYGMPDRQTRNS